VFWLCVWRGILYLSLSLSFGRFDQKVRWFRFSHHVEAVFPPGIHSIWAGRGDRRPINRFKRSRSFLRRASDDLTRDFRD
jgi:hypothetical protein